MKAEFGGGMRSFSCEEDYIYENIENEFYFFTSQVGCGGTRDMGQGCAEAGMRGGGDAGMLGKDAGMPECRDAGVWGCRAGMRGKDAGTWGREGRSSPLPQVKKGFGEPQPS